MDSEAHPGGQNNREAVERIIAGIDEQAEQILVNMPDALREAVVASAATTTFSVATERGMLPDTDEYATLDRAARRLTIMFSLFAEDPRAIESTFLSELLLDVADADGTDAEHLEFYSIAMILSLTSLVRGDSLPPGGPEESFAKAKEHFFHASNELDTEMTWAEENKAIVGFIDRDVAAALDAMPTEDRQKVSRLTADTMQELQQRVVFLSIAGPDTLNQVSTAMQRFAVMFADKDEASTAAFLAESLAQQVDETAALGTLVLMLNRFAAMMYAHHRMLQEAGQLVGTTVETQYAEVLGALLISDATPEEA